MARILSKQLEARSSFGGRLGKEQSLSSVASSVGSARSSVSSLWHTNNRPRGTHRVLFRSSVKAKTLTEFGVCDSTLRDRFRPVSERWRGITEMGV